MRFHSISFPGPGYKLGPVGFPAEIRLFEPGIAREILCVPLQHDRTQFEHVSSLRRRQSHAGVLFDQHDRQAFAVEVPYQIEQLSYQNGAESERRLVEHHQLGPGQQRPADRQHLLLAARQHRGRHVAALGEVGEALVDRLGFGLQIVVAAPGAHQQVLVHRQAHEDLAPLGNHHQAGPDAPRGGPAGDVGSVERYPSFGAHRAEQCLEQGALAGAVRAEHGDDLPVIEAHAGRLDRMVAAVADIDLCGVKKHWRHRPRGRSPRSPDRLREPPETGELPRAIPRISSVRN